MNNKIYIGLITSAGNAEHLEWYKMASKYIDGLAVTWHGEKDDGYMTLDHNKGCGFIVNTEYYGHHGLSMNNWFLNPKIRPGSWIIIRDTLEQCTEQFLSNVREFTNELERRNINTVYQYSKLLLFKKFEHQYFVNTPHWGLSGVRPQAVAIETIPGFEKPESYAFSIRHAVRPRHDFIDHFVKYTLIDSSNNLLLGNEDNQKQVVIDEEVRYKFKEYLQDVCKIELTVDALKHYLINVELTYEMKWFLNYFRYLNDFYCFHVLKHNLDTILARHKKKEKFEIK